MASYDIISLNTNVPGEIKRLQGVTPSDTGIIKGALHVGKAISTDDPAGTRDNLGLGPLSTISDPDASQIENLRPDLADSEMLSGKGTDLISYNGFLLVKRPLTERLKEGISFCDAGAKGNGIADDWEPMQDLINDVGDLGGGTINMPLWKNFRTSQELQITKTGVHIEGIAGITTHTSLTPGSEGVVGVGRHQGASRITGDFETGSIIRVMADGVELRGFCVDATDDRRTSSYGALNAGIRVEAPDVSGATTNRLHVDNVRITNQPGTGFLALGSIVAGQADMLDVDHVKGHAVWISGNNLTSRNFKHRPGQFRIVSPRMSRCGGQHLVIGGDDVEAEDIPYRIEVYNLEAFYNCITPDICFKSKNDELVGAYISGEQLFFNICAFDGRTQYPAIQPSFVPALFRGAQIKVIEPRFIDGTPYAAILEGHPRTFWSGLSYDITIDRFYATNPVGGAGFFNPAIYYGNDVRNPNISGAWHMPVVNRLSSRTVGTSFVEEWQGVRREEKQVVNTYNSTPGAIQCATIRAGSLNSIPAFMLNDNQAAYIQLTAATPPSGCMNITGNLAVAGGAVVRFRSGDASAFCTVESSSISSGSVVGTTGTLSGTTGVDGDLTISADTATNRIYIENRTGAQRTYSLSLEGTNSVTSVAPVGFV